MDRDDFYDFDNFSSLSLGDDTWKKRIDPFTINQRNAEGWTLLMYACNNGQKEAVEILLKYGATCRQLEKYGKTPLMLASAFGDIDLIALVFRPEDLDARDKRGWTAMTYATEFGKASCADYLLSLSAGTPKLDVQEMKPFDITHEDNFVDKNILLQRGTVDRARKRPYINLNTQPQLETPKVTPRKKLKILPTRTFTYSPSSPKSPAALEPKKNPFQKKIANFFPSPIKSPQVHHSVTPERKTPGTGKRPESVENFLKCLELHKYWPIFRDEEVDFVTFLTFEDHNLREIGVGPYGPRQKILKAIEEYQSKMGAACIIKENYWCK